MFHWYGLIVGVAVASVLWLIEELSHRSKSKELPLLDTVGVIKILLCVLAGARLWHVATDWQHYVQLPLWQMIAVWQGGLSILGAVVGLVIGVWLVIPREHRWWWLDALALSVPVGQAIGRMANYVNQELYGLPTDLPWKLYVDVNHRLQDFSAVAYYHPLFLYEILGLLVIVSWLWWQFRRGSLEMGRGQFFGWYLFCYSLLRFFLDYLRLARPEAWMGLGLNQLFLVVVMVVVLGVATRRVLANKGNWTQCIGAVVVCTLFVGVVYFLNGPISDWRSSVLQRPWVLSIGQKLTGNWGMSLADRQKVPLALQTQKIEVEVVNTDASRSQGLSGRDAIGVDGMLFVFPHSDNWVFWMKDMRFNLDLVWMHDGVIREITTNVPAPIDKSSPEQLPKYTPRSRVNMVLELPAGEVDTLGWKVGDVITTE